MSTVVHSDPPPGYTAAPLDDGFLGLIGPVYAARRPDGLYALAFRATSRHLNRLGVVHGGMLATLADAAIGLNLSRVTGDVETTLTLNLGMDYVDATSVGDWVEAGVELTKVAGRVRFGECDIRVRDRVVARAHATFYTPRPGI